MSVQLCSGVSNREGRSDTQTQSEQMVCQSEALNANVALNSSDDLKMNAHQKQSDNSNTKRRKTRRAKKRKWFAWHTKKRSRNKDWSDDSEPQMKEILDKGLPLAPYNTTQFIINDHCVNEINFDEMHGKMQRQNSHNKDNNEANERNEDNEDFYTSPEDESEYLQQQFHEAYDNIHAERINSMSKTELVSEYLQLEDRVEDLEKRLKESNKTVIVRNTNNSEVQTETFCDFSKDSAQQHNSDNCLKAAIFEEEIKKLSEENQRLKCDNERLQNAINGRKIIDSPYHHISDAESNTTAHTQQSCDK